MAQGRPNTLETEFLKVRTSQQRLGILKFCGQLVILAGTMTSSVRFNFIRPETVRQDVDLDQLSQHRMLSTLPIRLQDESYAAKLWQRMEEPYRGTVPSWDRGIHMFCWIFISLSERIVLGQSAVKLAVAVLLSTSKPGHKWSGDPSPVPRSASYIRRQFRAREKTFCYYSIYTRNSIVYFEDVLVPGCICMKCTEWLFIVNRRWPCLLQSLSHG